MPTEAVVIQAPVPRVGARVVEGGQHFTGEAVVPDTGNGPFDPAFVTRMPDARRVDVKVPRLRVLEKRRGDARGERIGGDDEGLGVIRNEDFENATKEFPRRFTRLDGARRRFFEGGIDEAVA